MWPIGCGALRTQMAGRHTKRCSPLLIIREVQIRTSVRYHFTQVRMAIIKKSTHDRYWRGCEGKEAVLHCWWECELVQPQQKTIQSFLKKTENRLAMWSSNPTPGNICGQSYSLKRYMRPYAYSSAARNSQDLETTDVPTDEQRCGSSIQCNAAQP